MEERLKKAEEYLETLEEMTIENAMTFLKKIKPLQEEVKSFDLEHHYRLRVEYMITSIMLWLQIHFGQEEEIMRFHQKLKSLNKQIENQFLSTKGVAKS